MAAAQLALGSTAPAPAVHYYCFCNQMDSADNGNIKTVNGHVVRRGAGASTAPLPRARRPPASSPTAGVWQQRALSSGRTAGQPRPPAPPRQSAPTRSGGPPGRIAAAPRCPAPQLERRGTLPQAREDRGRTVGSGGAGGTVRGSGWCRSGLQCTTTPVARLTVVCFKCRHRLAQAGRQPCNARRRPLFLCECARVDSTGWRQAQLLPHAQQARHCRGVGDDGNAGAS